MIRYVSMLSLHARNNTRSMLIWVCLQFFGEDQSLPSAQIAEIAEHYCEPNGYTANAYSCGSCVRCSGKEGNVACALASEQELEVEDVENIPGMVLK